MSREEEARVLLAQNEGIIMALTQASYRKDIGDEDMDVITTDGEFQDTADDLSMQSKMIQASLKKLLSAM
jgi:hypothetical protein